MTMDTKKESYDISPFTWGDLASKDKSPLKIMLKESLECLEEIEIHNYRK